MSQSKPISSDGAGRTSVLHEFFELLLSAFRTDGEVKNEWLMPFEPGPSSFPRKPAAPKPAKPRRRPF